jgi:NitT/TauT family transport system substrate-binding protein
LSALRLLRRARGRAPRRSWLAALTVVPALALAGCGSGPGQVTTSANGMTTVNLAEAVHNLGYIDLYVAQHKGYFTQQGITLNLSAAGGDSQAFAAVLGGSAQFALGDATLAEISREKGGDGVVLGELVSRAQYFAVSKKISTPFPGPAQFSGLTFVTSPPPNTNYSVLTNSLKQAGLDPAHAVKITTVSPGTEIGPVLAGQADVAVAYEPNVDMAVVQDGAHVVYSWADAIGEFTNTGLQARQSFVKANPQVAQKIMNALQMGAEHVYQHPDDAKAIARQEFPNLPPNVVDAAIQREIDNHIPANTTVVSQQGWQQLMTLGRQLGNCGCNVPFNQIIDNSFAQQAASTVHGQ